jgi:hypothetical protein
LVLSATDLYFLLEVPGSNPGGPTSLIKEGSPQENSMRPAFLGCFPKDHKFGLGRRYALRLNQQVAQVLVSPPAT